jgi:hypothetical protein
VSLWGFLRINALTCPSSAGLAFSSTVSMSYCCTGDTIYKENRAARYMVEGRMLGLLVGWGCSGKSLPLSPELFVGFYRGLETQTSMSDPTKRSRTIWARPSAGNDARLDKSNGKIPARVDAGWILRAETTDVALELVSPG